MTVLLAELIAAMTVSLQKQGIEGLVRSCIRQA